MNERFMNKEKRMKLWQGGFVIGMAVGMLFMPVCQAIFSGYTATAAEQPAMYARAHNLN